MEKVSYRKTFQTSPIIRQAIKDLKGFDDGDDNEDDMKLDHQHISSFFDVISSFSFGLCVFVCVKSTLGIKRPKTPCPRK